VGRFVIALALLGGLLGAGTQDELTAGEQAFSQGDHAGALVHWSVALKQARDEGNAADEVQALLRLAAVNRELGRLKEARDLIKLADAAGAGQAETQLSLGLIELDAGKVRGAEQAFSKSFAAAKDANDPQAAANAAVNLGLARLAAGDLVAAERAFTGALTLFETLDDPVGVADALTDRGLTRRRQGHLVEAQRDLTRAVELFRAEEHWTGEADALTNLGLVLQDLGQDAAAAELYNAALSTARTRRDVGRQATLLLNLGTLQHATGDVAGAAQSYAAAEQAFASTGQDAQALAAALNALRIAPSESELDGVLKRAKRLGDDALVAQVELELGVLTGDVRSVRRALDTAERLELADLRWRARAELGQLLIDQGDVDAGVLALKQAIDELERTRRALDASAGARFVEAHTPVYQALIDALLLQGDSVGAFVYAQRLQLADLGEPPLPEGSPEAQRYQSLVDNEAWLQQELARELAGAGEGERADALRAELAELRVEFARTVDELRATYADFDQLVRIDPEDLEAIQRELDPGVVVLQPILFDDRLVLLVFSHDTLQAVTVEGVEPQAVRRTISRLTRSLRAHMLDDPEWTQELCAQLGAWLIEPVAAQLQGAETLVVVPADDFQQLPFGLLRVQDQWLAEQVAVVGVTHVGSLRHHGVAEARFTVDGRGLLLIGNPDGTLPEAEAEVEAIARRYPGSTLVVGALGGRDALVGHTPGKQTVHLATHGVLDPKRPTRSYLVIGDATETDGRLAYGEIPGLAPYLDSARLVVLSACESGLPLHPVHHDGSELSVSINGLSAQFRRAGVETLVASLWKVDDAGTRALMEGLYDELAQGTDVAHAMQRAQLRLIEDPELSHPWYWSAFVVMGDWR
jgi:CHAT domain-containing protein/Tfp pilus assembly protein PilF